MLSRNNMYVCSQSISSFATSKTIKRILILVQIPFKQFPFDKPVLFQKVEERITKIGICIKMRSLLFVR